MYNEWGRGWTYRHVYSLHPAEANTIFDDVLVRGQHDLKVAGAHIRQEEFMLTGIRFANSPDQLTIIDGPTGDDEV